MSDSDALRQRRRRAHSRGDHWLCDSRRCPAAAAAAGDGQPAAAPEPGPGVTPLIEAFAAELRLAEGDPRAVIAALALGLARRADAGEKSLLLYRELRSC